MLEVLNSAVFILNWKCIRARQIDVEILKLNLGVPLRKVTFSVTTVIFDYCLT